jgi:hypothetical protein
MNKEDGEDAQLVEFEEVTCVEYRGYDISLSAKGLSTLQPEIKYQIFVTDDKSGKELICDSADAMILDESIEEVIHLAKEWIDIYETFHSWDRFTI